ncbi:MAG: hypothetical protein QW478_15225 [Candidatus Micrarchaeaceae archaeon]
MTSNIEKKRGPEDCRFYNSCSASLCPLDPKIKEKVWLPEESDRDEICRNKEFAGLQFIETQKKVARAVKKRNEDRDDYFSFAMLDRDITIKSGIRGIFEPSDTVKDPMKWYQDKERKWILKHPEKKQLSVEELERRRQRMKSIREEVEI